MGEGFYKLLPNQEGEYFDPITEMVVDVAYAPNFVDTPKVSIKKELKDTYQYPQDGWYWFNSEEEMLTAFGIEKFLTIEEIQQMGQVV